MDFADFRQRLIRLPRGVKRAIVTFADALLASSVFLAAFLLVEPEHFPFTQKYWGLVGLAALLAATVFAQQGLYRIVIRFAGVQPSLGALRGASVVAACVAGVWLWLGWDPPATVIAVTIVFWAFFMEAVAGSRLIMRAVLRQPNGSGERVAIYGAGEAGARLVAALAGNRETRPVAFLDDNPALQGRVIDGVPVFSPAHLPTIVGTLGVRRVLLALPSASRRRRQAIIDSLSSLAVHVQTMPDICDLVSGNARVDDLRDVDAADLLGRDAVPPNVDLLDACIRGKSVMVTGAGGSIGSELCRQIVRLGPRRIVLFEMCELALYTVEQDLRLAADSDQLNVDIVPLLGSVHHKARMQQALKRFQVNTVYHAAAYKHVPMVEHNMIEGIRNNIVGTWHAAEAAEACGVETFVLISTDKAVGPVNVMGATKRFAELVLQGLAESARGTKFCMVRFGNVLASSGSVVPLFRDQIRRGGPVTVTHPEIIRYFMTISEAAQLVLQAGSMSKGGDVFVLDMGEPVRITDLARRMIQLMGRSVRDAENPDGDIAIEFTGLRPAEKLYEELLIGTNVTRTEHPMIMRALERSLSWEQVRHYLDQMALACRSFDCERAREILLASVAGYRPAGRVEDLVWCGSRELAVVAPLLARQFQSNSRDDPAFAAGKN